MMAAAQGTTYTNVRVEQYTGPEGTLNVVWTSIQLNLDITAGGGELYFLNPHQLFRTRFPNGGVGFMQTGDRSCSLQTEGPKRRLHFVFGNVPDAELFIPQILIVRERPMLPFEHLQLLGQEAAANVLAEDMV